MIAARGIHHLAIQVRDLDAVERFYRDVLGLAVVRRWPAADGSGERSVWLDTGDGSFLALEVADAPAGGAAGGERGDGPGLHLVALRIAAADRRRCEDRLGLAAIEIYDRTPFTLYVRDPEGNRVGLSHFPDRAPEGSG